MASFVHVEYSTEHPGVVRASQAYEAVRELSTRFDSARGLAALLLAAVLAAVVVVADQMVSTWADGHLMAAWVVMWAIAFAVIGLFAGTARRTAQHVVGAGNRWAAARAQARADERLWALAQTDARVMADLRVARTRVGLDGDTDMAPPRGILFYL